MVLFNVAHLIPEIGIQVIHGFFPIFIAVPHAPSAFASGYGGQVAAPGDA